MPDFEEQHFNVDVSVETPFGDVDFHYDDND